MKIKNVIPANLLRTLCAAVFLTIATGTGFSQSAAIPTVLGGESVDVAEVARPEWRDENGKAVARVTLRNGEAAAWLLNFRELNLPEGAQMFLYGVDGSGATVSLHGPYEGHGPVNVPDFATDVIGGNSVVIEIRSASRLNELPFALESAETVSVARLAELKQNGLSVKSRVEPNIRKANRNPDIRSAYIGNRLVKYEVVDGKAFFEGDMLLGKVDELGTRFPAAASSKSNQKQGHITTDDPFNAYWPSGRVAYRITYSGFYGITQGGTLDLAIKSAIDHWNARFPGILYPRTNETNFVTVESDNSLCLSDSIGRDLGEQFIEVANSCTRGNLIHEFGHVLGMHHEHTRPDRDTFVTINWGNIQWDKDSQFEKPTAGESAASGAYDFGSIMHYPLAAFSSNGNNTISVVGTPPAGVTIGQRSALSAGDEATIRSLYCSGVTTKGPALVELDAEAGGGTFTFTAPPYCSWTVSVQAGVTWLKLTSSPNSSVVKFTVTENTGRYDRSASIRYNGRSTIIRQEGIGIFDRDF